MKKEQLKQEVAFEFEQMDKILDTSRQILVVPLEQCKPRDVIAAGTLIGNFYEGFENLLKNFKSLNFSYSTSLKRKIFPRTLKFTIDTITSVRL